MKRIPVADNNISSIVLNVNASINLYVVFWGAKLLQKSEMRKDIVIELSYKGFS